jgi:prolyl-tRNA editing enzyme YbaK/EbsC (Cys-tRNA(Pro) deacylase)
MTPAIAAARKAGIRHELLEYRHDPAADSCGLEAASHRSGVDRLDSIDDHPNRRKR